MQCYACPDGRPVGQCRRCNRFYCPEHAGVKHAPDYPVDLCYACAQLEEAARPIVSLRHRERLGVRDVTMGVAFGMLLSVALGLLLWYVLRPLLIVLVGGGLLGISSLF